ncbi:MAG: DNA alkylation repair protein [Candidatus Diapherotrites archaeon]|nr:DNA alkylation repair protein [Candidatus Diapherotrites archaeon]
MNIIESELRKVSNSAKAKILQGFFKTGKGDYGEGDVFLGVTVPVSRKIALQLSDLSFFELKQSLHSKFHEERLVALLILVQQFEHSDLKAQKKIFNFYLKNKSQVNNWDLVDLTAPKLVGVYLLNQNPKILFKLVKSKNLWDRRIAIVSSFAFIRVGNFDLTLKLSKLLLKDSRDLIHKAVGWMLREVGKRDVFVLEKFLKQNYKKMPRTMLRYAIERFPEKKRKSYLNGLA